MEHHLQDIVIFNYSQNEMVPKQNKPFIQTCSLKSSVGNWALNQKVYNLTLLSEPLMWAEE